MTNKEIKECLCYYDTRNPEGIITSLLIDEIEECGYGEYKKTKCTCDNCYNGQTKLAEELLKYIKR